MKAKISRWGNSLAVRLPKAVAEEARLAEGQEVELTVRNGAVELKPRLAVPRYTLEELLAQIEPGTEPPPFENWSGAEVPWPDDDWRDIAPSDEEMGLGDADGKRRRS